jgi:hypothetical protein
MAARGWLVGDKKVSRLLSADFASIWLKKIYEQEGTEVAEFVGNATAR